MLLQDSFRLFSVSKLERLGSNRLTTNEQTRRRKVGSQTRNKSPDYRFSSFLVGFVSSWPSLLQQLNSGSMRVFPPLKCYVFFLLLQMMARGFSVSLVALRFLLFCVCQTCSLCSITVSIGRNHYCNNVSKQLDGWLIILFFFCCCFFFTRSAISLLYA